MCAVSYYAKYVKIRVFGKIDQIPDEVHGSGGQLRVHIMPAWLHFQCYWRQRFQQLPSVHRQHVQRGARANGLLDVWHRLAYCGCLAHRWVCVHDTHTLSLSQRVPQTLCVCMCVCICVLRGKRLTCITLLRRVRHTLSSRLCS
jgi:hypothetical protein